ncbi:MAG: VOC family protein [Rhodospirillaceae bacterium]|nr:VOC family protein [Rhodospirillaceae bacterium]
MVSSLRPFHLAFPVRDIPEARQFYRDVLGCGIGRSTDTWIDFDFFGHQVVAHRVDGDEWGVPTGDVDGHQVPARHFGVVLDWDDWQTLADKLKAAGISFLIEPYIRFEGQPGEQATMFFTDPSGNALEFKSFKDRSQLFAT